MRESIAKLGIVVMASFLLSGCALLGIGKSEPRIQAMSTLPHGAEAFVSFEDGRAALDAGNNAAAIAAFSNSRMEPVLLAPSLNGMAVAYANMGRLDLAERYFNQAVAASPEDERFRANLARLQDTVRGIANDYQARILAEREQPRPETLLTGGAPLFISTLERSSLQLSVSQPTNRLARINPGQVELSTAVTASSQQFVRMSEEERGESPIRLSMAPAFSSSRVTTTSGSRSPYPFRAISAE